MSFIKFVLSCSILLGMLASCCPKPSICIIPRLASINIVNQDGLSETISNQERLKRFEDVDFMCPQPYQKVLRVYNRNPSGEILAYITSYHPNGQVKQYLEVNNGRAFGTYQEWYADGILKVEATIIGGDPDLTTAAEKTWLFDGLSKAWDEKGHLIAEIPYDKGQLSGTSIHYHPNGRIWKKTYYEKNQAQGLHEVFLDNGKLLLTTEFKNGTQDGKCCRYWDEGRVAAEEFFSNGRLVNGTYYDKSGNEISTIKDGSGFRAVFGKDMTAELHEYRHGVLEGQIKVFGINGRLAKIYHVKNGFKNGEEIEYYNKPGKLIPKLLVTWHDAKIQGVVRTWYDNGNLESQREMSQNCKNGVSTAWYRDGNLMLIEEYDQNKLMRGEYYKKGEKIPVSVIVCGKGVATLYDEEGVFIRRVNYQNGIPSD